MAAEHQERPGVLNVVMGCHLLFLKLFAPTLIYHLWQPHPLCAFLDSPVGLIPTSERVNRFSTFPLRHKGKPFIL